MTTRKRHSYDAEFKRNAASLYVNGKKSLSELTKQLGVAESTLYNWVSEYCQRGDESFKPKELSAQEKELLALKKQLADVSMERDILKKALTIFSKKK
ncbi:transposase [bacterium SCSIO 12844]|nr:transposase [bacterium SCSIO 12844]UTW43226.1 transposase [bacterium SCSIO 12844]UTW43494.1 transposase [bacterium SCSIO 12844]